MVASQVEQTVRIKVSPQVAKVVSKGAPRAEQLSAARGALPFTGKDLVTALFFLCHGSDTEVKGAALSTLRGLPVAGMLPVLQDLELHPQLLHFVAQVRLAEPAIMEMLLQHPSLSSATLLYVAQRGGFELLARLGPVAQRLQREPLVVQALRDNPAVNESLLRQLGLLAEVAPLKVATEAPAAAEELESGLEQEEEAPADEADEVDPEAAEEEELNLSKYQLALEMGVSEKIKMALTGDKEWRSIFLKDSNKLVSAAVMKNPRITDGEVLAVAKSKTSNDELIRLITMNREWVKLYEVRKALTAHPRTPMPKALRYLNTLVEKDLKALAKSRGVAQVIVNTARRLLVAKEKKGK